MHFILWPLLGACGLALGSIGPWVDATIVTRGGLSGDGWLTLIAAGLCGVILSRAHRDGQLSRRRGLGLLALGAVAAFVAIHDAIEVANVGSNGFISVTPGWGLYLAIAGSLLVSLVGLASALNPRMRAASVAHPIA